MSGATSYLPRVGMKYHYRRTGSEGRQEEFFLTVGRGSEGTLLTTLEWTPSEENYVTHFVAGTDGVYMVADSAPQSRAIWLPADLKPGTAWVADGNPCRVVKMGESLEHGGRGYRDCIVVERELRFEGVAPPVGGVLHQFYAPGVGLVLSRDARTGRVTERLLEMKQVGEQQAAAEVRQQSVSLDKIR